MKVVASFMLSFGLVNIPVGLATATKRETVSFKTLHKKCKCPIKQSVGCPTCKVENLTPEDKVKGFEYAKGEYVVIPGQDLAMLQELTGTTIDIQQFVSVEELDPVFYDKTYWLKPNKAVDSYAFLTEAMHVTGKAGIGSFTLWGKDNLCLVRAWSQHVLSLELLFLREDVRTEDAGTIAEMVAAGTPNTQHVDLARTIIDNLTEPFDPAMLVSRKRDSVRELIEATIAGTEYAAPEVEAEPAPIGNIMEALRASVKETQERKLAA